MKKRQFLYLIAGIVFLIAGIFFLKGGLGQAQSDTPAVQETVAVQETEAEAETRDSHGTVFDEVNQNEDNSKFTQFLIWLTDKDIPIGVYVAIFVALLAALRFGEYKRQLHMVEEYERRMAEIEAEQKAEEERLQAEKAAEKELQTETAAEE